MKIKPAIQRKAKNRRNRISRFLALVIFGVLLGAVLHMNLSCFFLFEDNEDDEEQTQVDTKAIEQGAKRMEDAFVMADISALSSVLSETSLAFYQPFLEEMQPHMAQFGEVIKTRKLLYANEIFAVYEYKNGNEVYTFEMMVNDDGQWIITRF